LLAATTPLPWWELDQYAKDLRSGQLSFFEFLRMALILLLNQVRRRTGMTDYATLQGRLRRTPQTCLNLQPGEIVYVKSKEEIRETLDRDGKNRGMVFSPEMTQLCGRKFVVLKRAHRMIVETTGHMIPLNDSVAGGGFLQRKFTSLQTRKLLLL
jgi:hypothetical protein